MVGVKEKQAGAADAKSMHKNRGTGFEAYFADPPITPAEAKAEQEIYSSDRSVVERIEECIQRYRSRRRFPNELRQFFDLYLFLGGIDTKPRQFNGKTGLEDSGSEGDDEDEDEDGLNDNIDNNDNNNNTQGGGSKSAAAKSRVTTMEVVQRSIYGSAKFYNSAVGSEHWDIDFTGVAAGFLSEALPRVTGFDYADMERAIGVIDNFLRYVLHHDVCPEYAADVRAAIDLCERARTDLPLANAALAQFPGEFNLAGAELFCPHYMVHAQADPEGDGRGPRAFLRPESFNPRVVFRAGVILQAPTAVAVKLLQAKPDLSDVKVLCEQERDLEVVAIKFPDKKVCQIYKGMTYGKHKAEDETNGQGKANVNAKENGGKKEEEKEKKTQKSFAAVGIVTLKTCHIEDGWYESPDQTFAFGPDDDGKDYLLDKTALAFLKPGMKLRLRVADLSIGLTVILQAMEVLVPWYTFLPQTLMQGYTDPKPNERPAPSAANTGADGETDEEGEGEDNNDDAYARRRSG